MAETVGDRCGHQDEAPAYVPLPGGLADPREQVRTIFDGVADLYDRARPGYPAEALADLVARCHIGPSSRVLEVGCGTGQATKDLAKSGAAIHCLEPGVSLAELARQNLTEASNVRVTTTTLENATEELGVYDVVVSATAFHWIDPHLSFAEVARLLRPGASIALLNNVHSSGGAHAEEPLAGAIRDLHCQFAPEIGSWLFPSFEEIRRRAGAGGDIAAVWSRVERKLADPPPVAHLFTPPVVSTYAWLASYDRQDYLAMLASQSSYALLNGGRRHQLLDGIGRLVDERLDGTITKEYVTILARAESRRAGPTT